MSFCSVLRPAMLSSFQFTGVWSATSIETLFLAILQFQTQSSLIPLYLCCISETASAEMNGRDQRNWWQKKRRGRCGTLGGVFFIWATTELFFVFFQIYSLPLWWPVKTLLNITLHLSRIRSPYSAVHVCNFEAFALCLSLSIFCLILRCLSKSNTSRLISQHVCKTYRYRLLLKSRFNMQMYCQFENYIPLLYEVVQFAYIKEPLSYEYINTDSSYPALWTWLLAAFWFKCLKKHIFVLCLLRFMILSC